MPQVFRRSANAISKASIIILVLLVVGLFGPLFVLAQSSWVTGIGVTRQQPFQFSHERHVAGNGIDCRYCHTSVETSPFAGIPATKTCMNCHSQIWSTSDYLASVRTSFQNGTPLEWTRVHDLPDFVYFDHSVHVSKGVGCSTCHGRVDLMPLVRQETSLQMDWCLTCHLNPERYVRPRAEVFRMDYTQPFNQAGLGARLVDEYKIRRLTDCSTCHR
jgi:hypothetical protein